MNKKELQKIWNQVPEDYYEKGIKNNLLKRYWHKTKIENFEKLTKKLKVRKILDVGCASGRMANEISKIFPKSKIYGIDIYGKAINYGRKHYHHIKFYKSDAHKLKFPANSFDLVVSYEVIEHVLDPQEFLNQIKRVVKKDGNVIIAMDSGSLLFRIVWWISEKTISRVWKNAHLHPFKHSELEKLIRKSGFKISKKVFSHFGMEVSFLLKKK